MPLPSDTKYRWKKLKSGRKVRLAFNPSGNVIEVKGGMKAKPKRIKY